MGNIYEFFNKFKLNELVYRDGHPLYIFAMRCAINCHPSPEIEYLLSTEQSITSSTNGGNIKGSWVPEKDIVDRNTWEKSLAERLIKQLTELGYKVIK